MGVAKAGKALGRGLIDSNPVTKAISSTLGALGITHVRNARGESLSVLKKAIARGDWDTVRRKASSSKWKKVQGIAQEALRTGATDYQKSKAGYYAKKGGPWPSSSGPAQGAGSGSSQGTSRWDGATPVSRSAQSAGRKPSAKAKAKKAATKAAPRAPRPCMYGPRDENGYCPRKPSAAAQRGAQTLAGGVSTAGGGRPCKYGPRGEDGYCPKKPAATTTDRALDAARRRAIAAGGSAAAAGAKYITKFLSNGTAIRVLARAALVPAAGLAAYAITRKLMQLRYRTYDELKAAAAVAYKQARREAGEDAAAGIFLPPEIGDQLAAYYRARLRLLNAHEAAGDPISGMVNLTFED